MTLGPVATPVRAITRRRLAILLPLAVGLVVGGILWRAGDHGPAAPPPELAVVEQVCAYPPAPALTPQPAVEKPMPSPDAWAGLERCIAEVTAGSSYRPAVTVADVRRWVEVEGDPVWSEGGVWWFPLSGEGIPAMPSGFYVGVPPSAELACVAAIMN